MLWFIISQSEATQKAAEFFGCTVCTRGQMISSAVPGDQQEHGEGEWQGWQLFCSGKSHFSEWHFLWPEVQSFNLVLKVNSPSVSSTVAETLNRK